MKPQKLVLILLAVITLVSFAACNNPWWPQRGDVTVDFNPNGGMGTPPPAQSVTDGESITVPTSNGLTRAGFYFDGWNTKADYSGKDYYVGQSYKTAGSATLFARWITADSPYYYYPYYPTSTSDGANTVTPRGKGGNNNTPPKVTYHSEIPGAGISPNIMARAAAPKVLGVFTVPDGTHTVKEGREFALDDPAYKPNYVFAEWVDDKDYYRAGAWLRWGTELPVTEDTNLYALWLEEDKVIKIDKKNHNEKSIYFDPQVYGSYDASQLKQTFTILNTPPESNSDTGRLTVVYEYRKDGTLSDENPFDISLGDMIDNIILDSPGLSFTIAPKPNLPIGNYSVIVRIYQEGALTYDDSDFYICFVAGFTVTPYPITIAITNIKYDDVLVNGTPVENSVACVIDALTPIEAGAYTERTAEITVVLSGFKETSGADGAALAFSVAGGLEFEKYADTDGVTETGIGGAITKTFTVKVTYDGKTEFPSGTATIGVGMAGLNGNYSVSNVTGEAVRVRDGKAETDGPNGRVIRVTKANNETPYGAITPFNAYATNEADSTWPRALTLNYKQMEHIVLDDTVTNNWAAIGNAANKFSGSYDGAGNTISNITIDKTESYQGMFGYNAGTVKNIGLENVDVKGAGSVAGVAGFNGGTVQYCYAIADAGKITSAGANAGGIAGYNGGTVQYCYAAVPIELTSNFNAGGVVGTNFGTVRNCYSAGTVTITSTGTGTAGGVIGRHEGTVENCYATGSVNASGKGSIGGVAGHIQSNSSAMLLNCVFLGSTLTGNSSVNRVLGARGNTNGIPNGTLNYNYARSGGTGANAKAGQSGQRITDTQWTSADWWNDANDEDIWATGWDKITVRINGLDEPVWEIEDGYLPWLLGMPGDPGAQPKLTLVDP